MRRKAIVGVACLLASGVGLAQQQPANVEPQDQVLKVAPPPRRIEPPPPHATHEELEKHGDRLRTEKFWLDAIDYYRAAIAKKPSAVLYNKLGIAELQAQRLKDAERDFKRATKLDKTYAEAYNNLGAVYYAQKKFKKSIRQYRKALELREDAASFHSNLGTSYFSLKNYEQAAIEYARAFQLDSEIFERTSSGGVAARMLTLEDRALYSYMLAKMYAKAGHADRSLEYLRKAMEEGYPEIQRVYKDQEFAELRKDPRFTELMAQRPPAIPQ